jgi:hypothetical protein
MVHEMEVAECERRRAARPEVRLRSGAKELDGNLSLGGSLFGTPDLSHGATAHGLAVGEVAWRSCMW